LDQFPIYETLTKKVRFMDSREQFFSFLPDGVSFTSKLAINNRMIYAPLCGIDATSIKSAITPYLSGDIKIDKFRYLTKPVSREDLRGDVRNFFVNVHGGGIYSLTTETAPDSARVEIGQLWHKLIRVHATGGLDMSSLNFIPVSGENVELMKVSVKNISDHPIQFTPTSVIPVFGRALDNKHDHEHVTALLNRVKQEPDGIVVEPTMAFNEEGHKPVQSVYFVLGSSEGGENPVGSFPTAESFYGDGGTAVDPQAIVQGRRPQKLTDAQLQGKEVVGALQFKEETLIPGAEKVYIVGIGLAGSHQEAIGIFQRFNTTLKFDQALEKNQKFWRDKSHSIVFQTGNADFNSWIQWVTLQPVLRRIFGCSFLPDHDYGKGGKGWRDIWQDLLSLILIEPQQVRDHLLNNFAGVRIDGTNATIIGARPGEFIADRNVITRVWMDHGVWPFLTTLLYIEQTGDFDFLFEQNTYFRDPQQSRTHQKDSLWTAAYGNKLKDTRGEVYKGTVLEHILVQNLVQFFNVGEHNLTRLENADWNDGLDMAFNRGESVAFMAMYAGNFLSLAQLLEDVRKAKKIDSVRLSKELTILLDSLSPTACDYNSIQAKKDLLFTTYFRSVQPEISGEKKDVPIDGLIKDLRTKAQWMFEQVRRQELLTLKVDEKEYQWFNGYYDNQGRRVEGDVDGRVRMTLTGQVFAVMSGLATQQQVNRVVEAINWFLKDRVMGGYRLNTDFGMRHYLDLGRAFGFAYGTKENGAFFSHMNVMYAYALYKRGFVREGREVLNSIYQMANDSKRAKIYPGVPEYFDSEGRGMYHYLTGSASWFVLTELTQVFGVRGQGGDLVIAPKLTKEEFGGSNKIQVSCSFADRKLTVIFENPNQLEYGHYTIKKLTINGTAVNHQEYAPGEVIIRRQDLLMMKENIVMALLQ
jgi:cellobiose phosphorylase